MAVEMLLDSNVVLRLLARSDRQHAVAEEAVAKALRSGYRLQLVPQVVMESWVVLTRPIEVNGFGWPAAVASEALAAIMGRFPVLPENEAVFTTWWSS